MDRTACIFGCSGTRLSNNERDFFADVKPLGFILFTRNATSGSEVSDLTSELQQVIGAPTFVLTDHEGGRVQRFTGAKWHSWLPALDQCKRIDEAHRKRALWLRYRIIAHELIASGINVNCVPVCDVANESTHPIVRNRCYSDEVKLVVESALTVADACLSGGVLPVIKHMPGLGSLDIDSHLALPQNDAPLKVLEAIDFVPFKALNYLPLGMVAHVLYQSIDNRNPSSQSELVISMIRESLGFNGLLMTDDLSMSALNGSAAERAKVCTQAGCDVILHCNGNFIEMQAVAETVGRLTGSSKRRAEEAIAAQPVIANRDCDDFVSEFSKICNESGIVWP